MGHEINTVYKETCLDVGKKCFCPEKLELKEVFMRDFEERMWDVNSSLVIKVKENYPVPLIFLEDRKICYKNVSNYKVIFPNDDIRCSNGILCGENRTICIENESKCPDYSNISLLGILNPQNHSLQNKLISS